MKFLFFLILAVSAGRGWAQTRQEDIHTDFVLYNKRVSLEKDLRERVVGRHFSMPLDSNSEDGYLSGLWAVEQFLFDGPDVRAGFDKLFAGYDSLGRDTRMALLEAVYGVEPDRYRREEGAIFDKEKDPKLFSLAAVYLYRADTSVGNADALKIRLVEQFPGYDTVPVLRELMNYLSYDAVERRSPAPPVSALFAGFGGETVVYSFQRWDRDYPGLAIVRYADGHFSRNSDGRLAVFEQLARSGPGVPYFLTNGNTPQGIYSIQGTDISHTDFIGPTPNLQLLMPGEGKWGDYFHDTTPAAAGGSTGGSSGASASGFADTLTVAGAMTRYLDLLPPGWRGYAPMREAFAAGTIGRTEIIAHGTTIDPDYYKGRPFYPLTPTMGCLCARELWNPTSGHLLVSEQNSLVNAFLEGRQRSDRGRTGWLVVVNLGSRTDAQDRGAPMVRREGREPVSRAELEKWVEEYEAASGEGKKIPGRPGISIDLESLVN